MLPAELPRINRRFHSKCTIVTLNDSLRFKNDEKDKTSNADRRFHGYLDLHVMS